MVDVTHDGHDRRTDDQVALVALVLTELEVEGLEQLAVLVLRGHDLDDVVELLADQLERLGVDRLGRRDHLAEREQHLHQGSRVDADLLGEVGQRRTAGQANGLAVALADAHATDRRGLHLLELLTTSALRLATATRRTTRTTEGTLGLATLTAVRAGTATAAGAEATAGTTATGSAGAGAGSTAPGAPVRPGAPPPRPGPPATTATGAARATGAGAEGGRGLGHHRRVGARHAGTAFAATGRRARRALVAVGDLTLGSGRRTAAHALAGRERVVARTRRTGRGRPDVAPASSGRAPLPSAAASPSPVRRGSGSAAGASGAAAERGGRLGRRGTGAGLRRGRLGGGCLHRLGGRGLGGRRGGRLGRGRAWPPAWPRRVPRRASAATPPSAWRRAVRRRTAS